MANFFPINLFPQQICPYLYCDRSLYNNYLIERDKFMPINFFFNKMRYITDNGKGSNFEIFETSFDEDEFETIIIQIPSPMPPKISSNKFPQNQRSKIIKNKTKKIYETKTIYYTKIVKVHKHKSRPKKEKLKKEEPKKEKPKKDKPKKDKPKKDKPKKDKPKKEKKITPIKIKTPEPTPEPEHTPEPEPTPEPETKKAKVSSVVCSTCSRKLTPTDESEDLKEIEEEIKQNEEEINEALKE